MKDTQRIILLVVTGLFGLVPSLMLVPGFWRAVRYGPMELGDVMIAHKWVAASLIVEEAMWAITGFVGLMGLALLMQAIGMRRFINRKIWAGIRAARLSAFLTFAICIIAMANANQLDPELLRRLILQGMVMAVTCIVPWWYMKL